MAPTLADSFPRIERKTNRFDRAAERDYQTRTKRDREKDAMAPRPLIILPDPKLRLISAPLGQVDDALRKLMDDMLDTIHDAPGIGLAAIQIAEPARVVVLDLAKKDEPPQPQYFVNPEIVWSSDERSVYEEGCLSIPEYYEEVERPAKVRARFLDREGKRQEIVAEGLLATALQHEIDHLDGVLFIDYISKLKRDRVVKKFAKMAKRAADGQRPL
jgi:peptide deformylase